MEQVLEFTRAPAPWVDMGLLLAIYELLHDSGVGMKERWNRLKGWSERLFAVSVTLPVLTSQLQAEKQFSFCIVRITVRQAPPQPH